MPIFPGPGHERSNWLARTTVLRAIDEDELEEKDEVVAALLEDVQAHAMGRREGGAPAPAKFQSQCIHIGSCQNLI